MPRLLAKLSVALDAGNRQGVATIAHGLKGVVAALHAGPALELAAALEQAAATAPPEELSNKAGSLKSELQELIASLEELAGLKPAVVA
jgi:HPt (histidine-containing phosphotransfer) domain-containing protein